jgi:hypothetical protein
MFSESCPGLLAESSRRDAAVGLFSWDDFLFFVSGTYIDNDLFKTRNHRLFSQRKFEWVPAFGTVKNGAVFEGTGAMDFTCISFLCFVHKKFSAGGRVPSIIW